MQYELLQKYLTLRPPDLLFHYTSPVGVIGILQSKKIWATHVKFLNDSSELSLAVSNVASVISRKIDSLGTLPEKDDRVLFLKEMKSHTGGASSDIYICSFTCHHDMLSQWRAYCPSTGGYSIGISSDQLKKVANPQGFYLAPCVYDSHVHQLLAKELVDYHFDMAVREMDNTPASSRGEYFIRDLGVTAAREVAKYGGILKHATFHEEKEWRLVSLSRGVNHPSIMHRSGTHSIIPYLEFSLVTTQYPDLERGGDQDDMLLVTIGPCRDIHASSFALQSLMHKCFPTIPTRWGISQTNTSFRGS